MEPLSGSDLRHFEAAQGWLTLGSYDEAFNELKHLVPASQRHPDALELHCKIYATQGQWTPCQNIAQLLIEQTPERLNPWLFYGRALHHLNQDELAFQILNKITDRFSDAAELCYLLGVIAASLGDRSGSAAWLKKAFELGGNEVRLVALQDDELKELWKNPSN